MNKEWLVLSRDATSTKHRDSYTNLLAMMQYLDEEKGHRFTDEQAEAIQALITNLIDTIRSYKHCKKR